MSMEDLVKQARSTRRFVESERIGETILRSLVDLARLTSCGGNQQKLRYRLVSNQEECDGIFGCIAWAGSLPDWDGPAPGERPSGYIAIVGEGGGGADVGIAAQTIQLAAAEMGYGACMLGAIKRDEIKAALGLPEPQSLKLLIALGRPAETIVIEEVAAGADLAYYRTEDDVHHVSKLRLADVLVD